MVRTMKWLLFLGILVALGAVAQTPPTPTWTTITGPGNNNAWYQIPFDPISGKVLIWYNNGGSIIFSNQMSACTDPTTGSMTCQLIFKSANNTGTDACPNDTTSVAGDRHPLQLVAYDSKRQRLWFGGGVNSACGQDAVTVSGTSVTAVSGWNGAIQWAFPTDGSLVGKTFCYGSGCGLTGTVASVTDATHLTATASLTSGSAVQFQVTTPFANSHPRADMYYMPLNSDPTTDVAVQIFPADVSDLQSMGQFGGWIYDPDDDVILAFSSNQFGSGSRVYAYAPTDGTGTMTSAQSATGAAADNWAQVTTSGTGPTTGSFPGLVYDPVAHLVINFGAGGDVTHTFEYAASAKTWTQRTPASHPGFNNTCGTCWTHELMAWVDGYNVTYLHDTTASGSDWYYTSGSGGGWTPLGNTGGSTHADMMTYDTVNNRFFVWNKDASTVYIGQITAPSTCSITTGSLPGGNAGTIYSHTVTTTGCVSPTFSISSGTLPYSLSLNSSTGVISGFLPTPATYSFTVAVTDTNGNPTQALSITVANPSLPSTQNTLTVKNEGSTASNMPIQIGRAFKQGDIPSGQSPQAWVGSTAVPTQVDSKNVWGDGSLRYAVISFLIPTFTSGTTYTVSLAPGAAVGNTALTKAQMLAAGYNFDAVLQFTKSAVNKSASAKTMLNATSSIPSCEGIDWTTSSGVTACAWTSGPIATTVIIANHANANACVSGAPSGSGSTTSAYDFGFDSFCAIRPQFHATFWPEGLSGNNLVHVRYIADLTNTQQMEDVSIDSMSLTLGSTSPVTVYSRATALAMHRGTRVTVNCQASGVPMTNCVAAAWINGTPPNASINHNLTYLGTTTLLPNYDPSKSVPSGVITTAYTTNWQGASTQCSSGAPSGLDLGAAGEWNANNNCGDLTQPAGHDWVGPMPAWTARWLYTGDYRMQIESLGNTDLLAFWPYHFREGLASKKIDRALTVPALGRPISVSSRPTFSLQSSGAGFIGGNSNNGDTIVPVGTASTGPYGNDPGHMAQLFLEYVLTGDYFYLEENLFWAAWHTWWYSESPNYQKRGPTGAEGGITDQNAQGYQLRGVGEAAEFRFNAWAISPDAMPDRAYLNQLNLDFIDDAEGMRAITTGRGHTSGSTACADGGGSTCTAEWNWGYNAAFTITPSTNRYWTTCGGTCGDSAGPTWVGLPPNTINFWDIGNAGNCDSSTQTTPSASACYKNWMYARVVLALGRGKELGYATDPLRQWVSVNWFAQVTDPTFNPFLTGAYTTGQVNMSAQTWYLSWAAIKGTFLTAAQNETGFYPADNANGSEFVGNGDIQPYAAAGSYLTDLSGGSAAWAWMNTNIEAAIAAPGCNTTALCDTKWAILPRSIAGPTTSTSLNGKITIAEKGSMR